VLLRIEDFEFIADKDGALALLTERIGPNEPENPVTFVPGFGGSIILQRAPFQLAEFRGIYEGQMRVLRLQAHLIVLEYAASEIVLDYPSALAPLKQGNDPNALARMWKHLRRSLGALPHPLPAPAAAPAPEETP
jgi:hypothetical protein